MAFAAGAAAIDLFDQAAALVVAVGVDGAERADAAGAGPVAGGDAGGHGDALAAFDDRQHVHAAHADCIDRLQPRLPDRPDRAVSQG